MSLLQVLLNLLFALLAFFLVRYIASLVTPNGQDADRVINIIAVIVAIIVFFLNLAAQLHIV